MTDTPPDWVLIEAAKRAKMRVTDRVDPFHLASWYDNDTFRALCDMIQKYEQPPVDRKVLCAEEASRQYLDRPEDEPEGVNWIGIRAVELWEEGFGRD